MVMQINELINKGTIFFIDEKYKHKIIEKLIEKGDTAGLINDKASFKKAIDDRELLMSTGIGLGIAIPHAKIQSQKDFFIITGILKNDVDWDSIDHKNVNMVFLIGGPDNEQGKYLRLLSQLILIVKDPVKRKLILKSDDIEIISSQFQ
jgi:nitrogen PTS system EIIA component